MSRKPLTDEEWEALCDQAVIDGGYTVDADLEYDEFLEETGLDDSFWGSRELHVPGTADLHDAAIRIFRRQEAQATPTA